MSEQNLQYQYEEGAPPAIRRWIAADRDAFGGSVEIGKFAPQAESLGSMRV